MTLDGAPPAARQEPKALIQMGGDLDRRHRGYPHRRQLDGEGYPIQPPTHLRDSPGILSRDGEAGTGRAGPLHEQLYRVATNLSLLGVSVRGKRQGTQRNDPLALQG